MSYNLILPSVMREHGVRLNKKIMIHCTHPRIDDHCISFKDIDLRISLQLNEIISYFNNSNLLPSELYSEDQLFITPGVNE